MFMSAENSRAVVTSCFGWYLSSSLLHVFILKIYCSKHTNPPAAEITQLEVTFSSSTFPAVSDPHRGSLTMLWILQNLVATFRFGCKRLCWGLQCRAIDRWVQRQTLSRGWFICIFSDFGPIHWRKFSLKFHWFVKYTENIFGVLGNRLEASEIS